jgi:hypothetical protein
MAKLPNPPDPTLAAADAALVAAAKTRYSNSLGAGWVGMNCERAAWYKLRHCRMPVFDAAALKRFADGHHSEDVAIARIRMVPGIEWHSHDPATGNQYGFSAFGGLMSGYYDGVARGLIQAPAAWHIGEIKASAKWQDLDKAKAKLGEKNALLEWNPQYYAQAQLYCHHEQIERHYTVVVSPGARDWTSCRTEYDPAEAMRLMARAERIIFSEQALPRISETPTSYSCKFCDFSNICHGDALPNRECRNCLHITADRANGWTCALGKPLMPCADHRYNPSALNMTQVDVVDGVVHYARRDGGEWHDAGI